MQKGRLLTSFCLRADRMIAVRPRCYLRRAASLAGFAAGISLSHAQAVWDGTTTLAATALGGNTIANGVTLTISSANDHDFYGIAIVNNGTVNWTGGQLRTGGGGTITNNGVWNDTASSNLVYITGGTGPIFNNATNGVYTKSGVGATGFLGSAVFNNDGIVHVNAGTLDLNGGGTNGPAGVIDTAAGATTLFSNNYTLAAGSALTGLGSYQLTGGTLTINGTVGLSAFAQTGGTLAGTHTFGGSSQFNWNSGNWSTGGTTTIGSTATLTISSANDHDWYSRAIVNQGTVNWTGGQLRAGAGSTITNNGRWNDTASSNYVYITGGTLPVFTNATSGTYNKNSTGTTVFAGSAFNNDGKVNVNAGTLELAAGGANSATGVIRTASGATTLFSNNYAIADGSALGGAGTYVLSGGTLSITGAVSISAFNQTGGRLAGTQTFDGISQLSWTGGDWNAGGTTTIGSSATLTISGLNDHDHYSRGLVNNGVVNWTGGQLRTGAGGTITNNHDWNDTASSTYVYITGGALPIFTNSTTGTYNKNVSGTTLFGGATAFNNDGVVNVNTGTLELNGGGTNSATGIFNTAGGATTLFSNNYTIANGSALTGVGTYRLSGGTLTVDGTVGISTFNQTGGRLAGTQTFGGYSQLSWTAGDWNSGGTTTIASNATLSIAGANDHDYYSRGIVNRGVVSWSGGQLRGGAGSTITNHGQWNDTASSNFLYITGGTQPVFTNASDGIYNKTGAGTTVFTSVAFNNDGTVNVGAGTFELNGGGTNSATGVINTASGATTLFSNSYTIANGSALGGLGTYQFTGGTLDISGTVGISTFNQTGGLLSGTQTFGGTSQVNWTGGTWNTGATTTIGSTATLTIAGANDHDFYTHALVNNGTVNWTGGQLRTGAGGTITNNGKWNDSASSSLLYITGGTAPSFSNTATGIYTKTTAGTTTFATPVAFDNAGTIDVQAGTLAFTGSFTNGGGTLLASGGNFSFTNPLSVGTGKIGGSGTFTAPSVTAGGVVAPGVSAGLMTIGGNLTLLSTATSQFEIGGTTRATQYDAIDVTGTAALAGSLQLSFINAGYAGVQSSDVLTLVNASAVTGAFGNIVSGSRLNSTDGTGSFRVDVTGSALTLSQFALGANTFIWSGGNLNTLGNVTPSLLTSSIVPTGAHLAIYTAADHDLNATAILNNGTVDWANGALRSGNAGSIVNVGTWNDSAGSEFNNAYNGTMSTFTNAATGVYNKTTGTTTMQVPFTNSGVVNATGGTLRLSGGGTIDNGAAFTGTGATRLVGGTFTASGSFTSSNLIVAGANLTGTYTLGGGTLTFESGTINSSALTIASGATLVHGSSANFDFNAAAIVNNGTFQWSAGAGPLRSGNAGSITNNALFVDAASNQVNNAYNGTMSQFINAAAGTYSKATAGQTTFSVPFTNSGLVNVRAGTLVLDAGGTINAGASFTGEGQTVLDSGVFASSGLFNSANLVLGGNATLAGTSSLGGAFTWASGNFNDGSTTTIPAGATLNAATTSSGNHDFNSHALVNNGTFNWSAGVLRSGNSGAIVNNALFIDTAASTMNNAYNGTMSTFTNAALGTYRKPTAGTTNFDVPFNNAGLVAVENGVLSLNAGGTLSGGAVFNGGGQTLLNSGTFSASGLITSSNVFLSGNAVLTGSSSLGGTFTWTSGNFNNGSTTTIPAEATLQIATPASHDFNSHAFVNNGTVKWSAGELRSGNSGSFLNDTGGVFNDAASSNFNNAYNGTSATFTNNGTYNKTAAGSTTFLIPFNNAGTVNVVGGTLLLNAGGTISAGAHFVGPGETVLNSGTFSADGLFTSVNLVLGGNASLLGNASLGGTVNWASGNFNNGSTTTIPLGATFEISTPADHDFNGHALSNYGVVNWTGGNLRSGNSGSFINQVTGLFNDSASAGINNAYNGTLASFTNNGVYQKTAAGTTLMQVPFINNNGALLVSGGLLQFTSSFTQSAGTVLVTNAAAIQFDNGLAFPAGILAGNGSINGAVTNGGLISPAAASDGSGTGTLNFSSSLTLTSSSVLVFEIGGTNAGADYDRLNVAGATTLGGTLTLTFAYEFQSSVTNANTFTLLNAGTISGSFLNVANGQRLATLDNFGSFQVNYGSGSAFAPNLLVLSAFTPVPEPATYALFGVGLAALLALRRRRQR
jgi:hypothetical protein